jgi:HTH-type transcriptional regulator/antitoxin HigA
MEMRPIRNDKDHSAALEMIESLWGADAGTPDADKLDVLVVLVDAYENDRWPVEALDPIETIKAHMEATGRNQSDLGKILGSRSRASEVIARKRPLTINMERAVASSSRIADCTLQTEKAHNCQSTLTGKRIGLAKTS